MRTKQIAIELFSSIVAGAAAAAILYLFADRFEHGATWSGLNPGGGGPGFLVLGVPALFSFFLRTKWVRDLRTPAATLQAAIASAVCGFMFFLSASSVSTLPSSELVPILSGVVGSFFVPRVVSAVLNETWTRAESSNPDKSQLPRQGREKSQNVIVRESSLIQEGGRDA